MKKSNYITPKGFHKLSDELSELLKIERPKICEIVKWAASLGDRSENADYIYGKKRLREIDKRINFLSSRIDDAQIVDPKSITSNKVQFGATVLYQDEEGNNKTVSIVGVDEIDPAHNKLSWKAPICQSLIGKMVGDFVVVKRPSGEIEVEILAIEYKEIP